MLARLTPSTTMRTVTRSAATFHPKPKHSSVDPLRRNAAHFATLNSSTAPALATAKVLPPSICSLVRTLTSQAPAESSLKRLSNLITTNTTPVYSPHNAVVDSKWAPIVEKEEKVWLERCGGPRKEIDIGLSGGYGGATWKGIETETGTVVLRDEGREGLLRVLV